MINGILALIAILALPVALAMGYWSRAIDSASFYECFIEDYVPSVPVDRKDTEGHCGIAPPQPDALGIVKPTIGVARPPPSPFRYVLRHFFSKNPYKS